MIRNTSFVTEGNTVAPDIMLPLEVMMMNQGQELPQQSYYPESYAYMSMAPMNTTSSLTEGAAMPATEGSGMPMAQSVTPSAPTDFQYLSAGYYTPDQLAKQFSTLGGKPISSDDVKKVNPGSVYYNQYDILNNYDVNRDGKITKSDIDAINFMAQQSDGGKGGGIGGGIGGGMVDAEWTYNGDGAWEYNVSKLAGDLSTKLGIKVDAAKLGTKLNSDITNDLTLYNVFDTDKDGKLDKNELSSVLSVTNTSPPATTPPGGGNPVAKDFLYNGDGAWNYDVEKFAVMLEGQTNTKVDRAKLREALGITFSDRNNFNDGTIYSRLDKNKDKKMDVKEITDLVNQIKGSGILTPPPPMTPAPKTGNADMSGVQPPMGSQNWFENMFKQPMNQPVYMVLPVPMHALQSMWSQGMQGGMMPNPPLPPMMQQGMQGGMMPNPQHGYQSLMGRINAPGLLGGMNGNGMKVGQNAGLSPNSIMGNPRPLSQFLNTQM